MYGFGAFSIPDLAAAIARFEGACSGTSCRNNNPGNLRAGPGAIGTDSRGIAIFPDYATGEAALEHQIGLNVSRGLTLDEFFGGKPGVYAGYAPAADANNPGQYAGTVAGWLGIDPNTPLPALLGGPGAPAAPVFDSGAPSGGFWTFPGGDDAGLSGAAMAGLGLAAAGLLLAALS